MHSGTIRRSSVLLNPPKCTRSRHIRRRDPFGGSSCHAPSGTRTPCYFFTSLILALLTAGSPPSGEKVTLTATLTVPCWSSRLRALPLDLTGSVTVPADSARLVAPLTFLLSASSTPPGPGMLTSSLAVPLRLFFVALPRLKSFEGGVT